MSLAAVFDAQAEACERLGSPFMARLLRLCGSRLDTSADPVARRLADWPGDVGANGAAIALRFAGALHALVLTGADDDLIAAYPPHDVPDATLRQAVESALGRHRTHIMHWLESAPQTNEVRRSTAMIAATQTLASAFPGLPFRLSELGASAGLNLFFDRYALALPDGTTRGAADPVITLSPDWTGPLPPEAVVTVNDRRGVDLNPLDPSDPSAVLRLRSYTWPDQPDRMQRIDAALTVASPVVDRGDAGDWLRDRLSAPRPGVIDLVFHTIAWQYFPPETDAACRAALDAAGKRARTDAPLAHLSVEAEPGQSAARVRLTLWTGGAPGIVELGRMDPHGRRFDASRDRDTRPLASPSLS